MPTFIQMVREVASATPHEVVASKLGVKRAVLRNWIYKDVVPNEFTMRVLTPIITRMWNRKRGTKKETNANRKRNVKL